MEHTYLYETSRTLPSYGSFDTVVVGGGFAGVAAALSAARNGAKTCLIEKEFSLGSQPHRQWQSSVRAAP